MIYFSLILLADAQKQHDSKLTEGFWLTDGYGELVEFDGTALRSYELTSISCIPAQTRQLDETRSSISIAVFPSGNSVITVRRTDDPNILHMRWDWAAADIILNRTGSLPEQCRQNPPTIPRTTTPSSGKRSLSNTPSSPFAKWIGRRLTSTIGTV